MYLKLEWQGGRPCVLDLGMSLWPCLLLPLHWVCQPCSCWSLVAPWVMAWDAFLGTRLRMAFLSLASYLVGFLNLFYSDGTLWYCVCTLATNIHLLHARIYSLWLNAVCQVLLWLWNQVSTLCQNSPGEPLNRPWQVGVWGCSVSLRLQLQQAWLAARPCLFSSIFRSSFGGWLCGGVHLCVGKWLRSPFLGMATFHVKGSGLESWLCTWFQLCTWTVMGWIFRYWLPIWET